MLTIKEGTNLTGLEGNVLRILQGRQLWKSAAVDRVGGQVMVTGTRPSKVERGFHELRPAKDSVDTPFSGELRRMAIHAVNWSDPRILGLQDAIADPGLTPLQPDWSMIRDSSDAAISKMFAVAVEFLKADTCPTTVYSRDLSFDRGHACGRAAKFESLEEATWRAKEEGRINRLYCKTHSPAVADAKRAEQDAYNRKVREAQNRAADDRKARVESAIKILRQLIDRVQDSDKACLKALKTLVKEGESYSDRGLPYDTYKRAFGVEWFSDADLKEGK